MATSDKSQPPRRFVRYAPFIIVALVLVAAIAGGAALYRAHSVLPLPQVGVAGAEPAHVRGPKRAPVVVEEFGDFQCPPCGLLAKVFDDLEKEMPGKFQLVFRNYPLVMHKNAVPAAQAVEAAGLQGKYWEMHHLIYETQTSWSNAVDPVPAFESDAAKLGLDVARFKADMQGEPVKARIAADQRRATSLGVDRTPSVFVNNERVAFTQVKTDVFRDAVNAARNKK